MYAPHEFFEDESNPLGDPWSVATRLNVALLDKLARGPVPGDDGPCKRSEPSPTRP